jgi:hypothetical protein
MQDEAEFPAEVGAQVAVLYETMVDLAVDHNLGAASAQAEQIVALVKPLLSGAPLEVRREFARAYYVRGLRAEEIGDQDRADSAYTAAVYQSEADTEWTLGALNSLAVLRRDRGQLKAAREAYDDLAKRVASHSGRGVFLFALGQVCQQLGDREAAIRAFTAALDDPYRPNTAPPQLDVWVADAQRGIVASCLVGATPSVDVIGHIPKVVGPLGLLTGMVAAVAGIVASGPVGWIAVAGYATFVMGLVMCLLDRMTGFSVGGLGASVELKMAPPVATPTPPSSPPLSANPNEA